MKRCSARRLSWHGSAASSAIAIGNFLSGSMKSGRPKTAIRPGRAGCRRSPCSGLRDLVPLVDNAFREDRIPEEWIDRRQFDEDLADSRIRARRHRSVHAISTSVTSRTCWCRWIGCTAPKTSSTRTARRPRGPISSQTSRSGIPGVTSGVTIHAPVGAARSPRNAALPMASRRHDAGRPESQCAVIQARASRCAVAISASDIIAATSRRMAMASARPFRLRD